MKTLPLFALFAAAFWIFFSPPIAKAASLEYDLNFDDNQTPSGWSIPTPSGPGINASVANQRFEARQVDTYAQLQKTVQMPIGTTDLEMEYTGNISNVFWGMGSAVRVYKANGEFTSVGMGKDGYGIATMKVYVAHDIPGVSSTYAVNQSYPLDTGTYRNSVTFRDGSITFSVKKVGTQIPINSGTVAVPSLKLSEISKLSFFAFTTTGEAGWVDDVRIRAMAPSDETEILSFGSTWTWLHPINGQDPAQSEPGFQANWMLPSHSNFPNSGEAPSGYGVFDFHPFVTDIGTPPSGQRYTAYFRRQFTVSSALTGQFYTDLLCDDGVLIYVDGALVGRHNYNGSDTYTGLAPAAGPENRNVWKKLTLSSLSAGTHTIAVSVHNNSATSSDLAFDMRLLFATGTAEGDFEKPEFGSKYRIQYSDTQLSWSAAKSLAESVGGHLPIISSAAENNYVFSLLSADRFWRRYRNGAVENHESAWLGASQPVGSVEPAGGWIWVDQTPLTFSSWRSGEPDNGATTPQGNLMMAGTGGRTATWNDMDDNIYAHVLLIEFPLGPSVLGVSPAPVPGQNAAQPFVLTGTSFEPSCTVTLRNLSTGAVYPNRTKAATTAASITLNPNFGNATASWSVEVINPGGVSSGQFPFSVNAGATLTVLGITGVSTLAAGQSSDMTATATFSNATQSNVSASTTWGVTGGPTGTTMVGSKLVAGKGAASTATLTASYSPTTASGARVATKSVSIGGGFDALITGSAATYVFGVGASLNYRLVSSATTDGAQNPVSIVWNLDDTVIAGANTALLDAPVATSPGPHVLKVTLTDGLGRTVTKTNEVGFQKARNLNEQYSRFTREQRHPGALYSEDATTAATYPRAASKGLVVIIHGMNNKVTTQAPDNWTQTMAQFIVQNLGTEAPNIILYDWEHDADTTLMADLEWEIARDLWATELWPSGSSLRQKVQSLPANAVNKIGGALSGYVLGGMDWGIRLIALRDSNGELHGQGLASFLETEIAAGRISHTAPIHLIGHSAGGFVASVAGGLLLKSPALKNATPSKKPTNLQVTALDTPVLKGTYVNDVIQNGGKYERYVSSWLGAACPGLSSTQALLDIEQSAARRRRLLGFSVTPLSSFPLSQAFHYGEDTLAASAHPDWIAGFIERHSHIHDWYTASIHNRAFFQDGWYFNPFNGQPFPGGGQAAAPAFAPLAAFGPVAQAAPAAATSGFSTFGNVTQPTTGSYTLTEQGNAGIYQTVTLPMNVSTVKFRVQFTQPGDGDYVEVSFGDHLSLAVVADGSIVRAGLVEFEVPVVHYGGETGQLLFKLNGLGADNAVAVVDSIEITTADDADGDGLTFAQETALGTDPRYYDSDADGLDDAYEANVSLTNPLLADTDGDGLSDAAELTAGTNPLLPASRLKSTLARNANGSVTLTWDSVVGKTYTIIRSPDAGFTNFDVVASALISTAASTAWTDNGIPAGSAAMFYVVQVEE